MKIDLNRALLDNSRMKIQTKYPQITVPGSTMLLGEHAVVYGHPALVAAIDKTISAQLTPRTDSKIIIDAYRGRHETDIANFCVEAPYNYVLAAIKNFSSELTKGFELTITSEFSSDKGFGSSAAVTVATVALMRSYLKLPEEKELIFKDAYAAVLSVQNNFGSGADVAASVYGGVIKYQNKPFSVEKISDVNFPISLLYCGYKTPTKEVVQEIKSFRDKNRDFVDNIFNQIEDCVKKGWQALHQKNYSDFGHIANHHQTLLDELGVNTPELQQLVDDARTKKNILGAKISGSGLGDCVIVFGELPPEQFESCRYDIKINPHGCQHEQTTIP